MCEPLIFSDLDGTLILSASRKQPGDIVCEYKDNREISCITKRQAELLPGLEIIPVTTRSIEQYRRIRFPEGFSPEYALTDNGGTLLVNGVPDPDWARRTMRLVQESSRGLERCRSVMEQDPGRNFEIRMVDGMFLFTKSTEPESMLRRLNEVSGAEVSCFATGAKVYALPAGSVQGGGGEPLCGYVKRAARFQQDSLRRGQRHGYSNAERRGYGGVPGGYFRGHGCGKSRFAPGEVPGICNGVFFRTLQSKTEDIK